MFVTGALRNVGMEIMCYAAVDGQSTFSSLGGKGGDRESGKDREGRGRERDGEGEGDLHMLCVG